jgi:hypothetical protein
MRSPCNPVANECGAADSRLGLIQASSRRAERRNDLKTATDQITAAGLIVLEYEGPIRLAIASNCQELWIDAGQVAGLIGGVRGCSRSPSLPLTNVAPARTSATRCGAVR